MPREPLAAFDDAVIEAVAAETDVPVADLRALLRRHQQQMRDLPGADDIVYEWRKALPGDPLVDRREDAYLLALTRSVWPEFAAALSLSDAELAALRRVHARQVAADADAVGDDADAMVVTRP